LSWLLPRAVLWVFSAKVQGMKKVQIKNNIFFATFKRHIKNIPLFGIFKKKNEVNPC
jgi:hypothetical protein